MNDFPVDARQADVIKALRLLGFKETRPREHIIMVRSNTDGTSTKLSLPNHRTIKKSTLRAICTQAGIARQAFLDAYKQT